MKHKSIIKIENYFEVFLIIFFLGLFVFLIHSYLLPLFLAATLVFLFHETYVKLCDKTKNETISALFIMFIVISIILIPTYIISVSLVKESSNIIENSNQIISNLNLDKCEYSICRTIENNLKYVDMNLEKSINLIGNYVINSFDSVFNSVSKMIIDIFVFILAFYFLLKDGDKFVVYLRRIIPMKNEYKNALFLRFKEISLAVFIDSIFVAIIQGTLLGIGFYLFNIPSALFWGIIGSLFALLPLVGTGFIWFPASIYLFATMNNPIFGILFIVYCAIIVGLSDNVIRTILLNKKTKVHPFLILISVIGGIQVFGFFGLFLGPIIISMLISVLKLYNLDFH